MGTDTRRLVLTRQHPVAVTADELERKITLLASETAEHRLRLSEGLAALTDAQSALLEAVVGLQRGQAAQVAMLEAVEAHRDDAMAALRPAPHPDAFPLPVEQLDAIRAMLERAVASMAPPAVDLPSAMTIDQASARSLAADLAAALSEAVAALPRPLLRLPDTINARVIEAPTPPEVKFPGVQDVRIRNAAVPMELTDKGASKLAEALRGAITVIASGGGGMGSVQAATSASEIEADLDSVLDAVTPTAMFLNASGPHTIVAAPGGGRQLQLVWIHVQGDAGNSGQVVATVTTPTGETYQFPLVASQPMVRSRVFTGSGPLSVSLDTAQGVWVNAETRVV